MKKVHNETPDTASPLSTEQYKKMLVISLIKMSIPLVLCTVVFCLASVAWFVSNNSVFGEGAKIQAEGMPFEIVVQGDGGVYLDQFGRTGSEAKLWLVDEAHHFNNILSLEEDQLGIKPGDSGVLQFRIDPKMKDSIAVDLVFQLRAFSEEEETKNLTEIIDTDVLNFVNAHIMLFTECDENGQYSGLIESNEQLQRLLINQVYQKNNTDFTQIYWVWPEYISNLIRDDKLLYQSSEKATVIAYIVKHKSAFFRNLSIEATDEKLTEDLTKGYYQPYSSLYDKADIEIGKQVDYVILSMNANLSTKAQN